LKGKAVKEARKARAATAKSEHREQQAQVKVAEIAVELDKGMQKWPIGNSVQEGSKKEARRKQEAGSRKQEGSILALTLTRSQLGRPRTRRTAN
jgi:hypothetical protein